MQRRGFFQRTFSALLTLTGVKAQPTADQFRELASVVSVDGATIGGGEPGPIARAIHRAYRVRVGVDGPLPWE